VNDLLNEAMTRKPDEASFWRTELERIYRVNEKLCGRPGFQSHSQQLQRITHLGSAPLLTRTPRPASFATEARSDLCGASTMPQHFRDQSVDDARCQID
jgi:hypothetical protein